MSTEAFILRGGGGVSKKVPEFTYSGSYQFIDDGDNNWRIRFLTSGTLRFVNLNSAKAGIDVFCVGGGGAGGKFGGGGAGGFTKTSSVFNLEKNVEYQITVGAGGIPVDNTAYRGNSGGSSSAFGVVANGGSGGGGESNGYDGGVGGSGGAARNGAAAGYDGTDGGGKGQRNFPGPNGETGSTKEFGETTGTLYSGGGGAWAGSEAGGSGGGGAANGHGSVNTGGGGGASYGTGSYGGIGGSGIVVIRNRRA